MLVLVASFTGQRRRLRPLIAAGWCVYVALSLCALASVFWLRARVWSDSAAWSAIFVATEALLGAVAVFLLVRHIVRSRDRDERRCAAAVLAAVLIGVGLTTTTSGTTWVSPYRRSGAWGRSSGWR